jgi:predicted adenylyl cyclase CyaB
MRRNLELKARCEDLAGAAEGIRRLGAVWGGLEIQQDTFFHVAHGRLKLRQITGGPSALVWYDRPNAEGVRTSTYHLVPIEDASGLKAALAAALGVRGEVSKKRHIYFWHNVRIHLDEVMHLGSFVEFEAVLTAPEEESPSEDRLAVLCQAHAIKPEEIEARSYADLLGLPQRSIRK